MDIDADDAAGELTGPLAADAAQPGDREDGGRGVAVSAAASAAAVQPTLDAIASIDAATKVAAVLNSTAAMERRTAAGALPDNVLRSDAARARASRGRSGKDGARGRLKGHLFEELDIATYNTSSAANGNRLVKRSNSCNPAYDASRFGPDRRNPGKDIFKGAVQHKSSSAGAAAAVRKMEETKPGSARCGIIRVPADEADATRQRVGSRARVEASEITSEQLEQTLDLGLDALARDGAGAMSKKRQVLSGTAKAAARSAAVGAVTEARALARGEVDPKTFALHRAQDAGEAAIATTVATAAEKLGKASCGSRAVAQGAARSAAVTVVVSSLRDVPALARGQMSGRDFAENRGIDALEAGTATAIGAAATAGVLGTTAGAAAAARVGGAAESAAQPAAAAAARTGTAAGRWVATALGGVTAAPAGRAIVGGAVVIGTGLVVGKGFETVRKRVKTKQANRRQAATSATSETDEREQSGRAA
jgi:hypothetical protein